MISNSNIYTTVSNNVNYLVYPLEAGEYCSKPISDFVQKNPQKVLSHTLVNQMLYLPVPGYMTLGEYIQGKFNKKSTLHIVGEIVGFARLLERYNLPSYSAIWSWEYIYVNPENDNLLFVLIPLDFRMEGVGEVENLLRIIMSYLQYDMTENCHYVAQVLSVLNSRKTTSEILETLDKMVIELSRDASMRQRRGNFSSEESGRNSLEFAKESWDNILNQEVASASEQRAPRPYLLRLKNNERIYILKEVFTLGKDSTVVDYAIRDNSAISRFHAKIVREQGVYYLQDNYSTNGTFVNGNPVKGNQKVLLMQGALVNLAGEKFQYCFD